MLEKMIFIETIKEFIAKIKSLFVKQLDVSNTFEMQIETHLKKKPKMS